MSNGIRQSKHIFSKQQTAKRNRNGGLVDQELMQRLELLQRSSPSPQNKDDDERADFLARENEELKRQLAKALENLNAKDKAKENGGKNKPSSSRCRSNGAGPRFPTKHKPKRIVICDSEDSDDEKVLSAHKREVFKVFIGADFVAASHCYCPTKEISLPNLALFPPFLRFDNVVLPFYRFGASKSITEKCQLFDACLSSIKEALIDSNKIFVYSHINQESAHHFSDHQTLLDYLSKRLLPICASSRSYNFWLWFHSDENSMGNVIDSILRMPQVGSSSNVAIDLYTSRFPASIALPVETISTWLNRNVDAMKSYQKGVFLRIFSHRPHQNFTEMFALLKMRFKESKLPALPFTLQLELDHLDDEDRFQMGMDNIEDQIAENKSTNEQLSISKKRKLIEAEVAVEPEDQDSDRDSVVIEVKRARKKEKEKKNGQTK